MKKEINSRSVINKRQRNLWSYTLKIAIISILTIKTGLLSTAQGDCLSGAVEVYYCTYSFRTTADYTQITVDGFPQNSPYNDVSWAWGTTHNVIVPLSQSIISGQSQYVFSSWDFTSLDGNITTTYSQSISITSELETSGVYSANYNTQYYLTVSASPDITTISGSGWYDSDTTPTLTAPTTVGPYTFSTWTVDGNPVSGNPISVSMNGAHKAIAVFTKNQYNISVSTYPQGLTPQPSGAGRYTFGDTATVIAQPVNGYTFKRWIEDGSEVYSNDAYSFNVTGGRDLIAEYTQTPYTVSVLTSPSGITPQPSGGGTYFYGDSIIVAAQAAHGYKFQDWSENGSIISNNMTYNLNVTGDRNLVANYIQIPYTVSVLTSPSGITPQPSGSGKYYYGDSVTVIAQTVQGYTFQSWNENGFILSRNTTYYFNVANDRNLIAEYTQDQYKIFVSTYPRGLTQPSGGGTYYYGDSVTVTAQLVSNYSFRKWIENGKLVSSESSYSFILNGNRDLIAEYSKASSPNIILDPISGQAGTDITVTGRDFDIFEESLPTVSIYLDNTPLKDNVKMDIDDSGTLGSFITKVTIPKNSQSGKYTISIHGPKNSASVPFTVDPPTPLYILIGTAVIGMVVVGKVAGDKITQKRKWLKMKEEIENIHEETKVHVEYENFHSRNHDMNWTVKGGLEKL